MKTFLSFFLLVIFTVFLTCIVRSQVPRIFSYQGILSDTTGAPKPDADYSIMFKLYSVPTSGNSIWSETQTVHTKRGLFSIILGGVVPFPDSLKFNQQYWLGIQLVPYPEMSPRIPFTSVPFSINAAHSDTSEYVKHSSPIPTRSISLSKIDTAGATDNQVITYSGG